MVFNLVPPLIAILRVTVIYRIHSQLPDIDIFRSVKNEGTKYSNHLTYIC